MDKETREGLGLIGKQRGVGNQTFKQALNNAGLTNPFTGTRHSTTFSKNIPKKYAKHAAGKNNIKSGNQKAKIIADSVKRHLGINESAIFLINKLLEEYSTTRIPKNSAAPSNNMPRYQEPRARYTIDKLNKNMADIIENKIKAQQKHQQLASKIEPGTEMSGKEHTLGVMGQIHDKNAEARYQAAQNHAQALELRQQQLEGEEQVNGEG